MKNLIKSKKFYKFLFISGAFLYVLTIFVSQQKTLNSYKNEQEYYSSKINEQLEYKQSLANIKENINSPEYIEQAAREKLDMYLPNERVYIDIGR